MLENCFVDLGGGGGGGTDLAGLGVDNRITRWDGTDTLQSSLVSLDDSGNILPTTDDAQDLGENSTPLRWANVYARNLDVLISGAANVGATIQAASSQTANLFELKDSGGNDTAFFDSNGGLALRAAGNNIRQSFLDATDFNFAVNGTNSILRFQVGAASTVASGSLSAIEGTLTLSHTANTLSSASGLSLSITANQSGTGDVTTITGLNISTDLGTARDINAITLVQAQHSSGSQAMNVGAYSSYSSFVLVGNETLDEAVHMRINGASVFGTGGITFHAGIKLQKITQGSSRNRGILINDDGVGADITFGSGFYGNISVYRNATSGYLEIDTDIQGLASGGVHIAQDNQGIHFGALANSGDCRIYWDGSNMIFDPDSGSEGTGVVLIGATGDDTLQAAGATFDAGGLVNTNVNINGSTDFVLRATATDTFVIRDSTAGSDRVVINSTGDVQVLQDLEIDGGLNHDGSNIGFFGTTPTTQAAAYTQTYSTADRTLAAYTADDESGAYTGIDNAQAGTVYAQLTDLNALRTAYENLRSLVEDATQMMNALVDDMQSYGLVQ